MCTRGVRMALPLFPDASVFFVKSLVAGLFLPLSPTRF